MSSLAGTLPAPPDGASGRISWKEAPVTRFQYRGWLMPLLVYRGWLVPLLVLLLPAAAAPAEQQNRGLHPVQSAAAQATDAESGPAPDSLDPADAYRLELLKIKGHLGVARALLQLGDPGAGEHLGGAIAEIFDGIALQLSDRNAPLSRDTLTQLEAAVDAAPAAALTTIDDAASAIDGSFAQLGPLSAESALALSEALLREAVALYTESVSDNEVVDDRAYQTGRGYVVQAEALVRHSSGIKGAPGHEALLAAVVLVRQAWPGIRPPPIVFDPQSVADRLEEAVAAMDRLR